MKKDNPKLQERIQLDAKKSELTNQQKKAINAYLIKKYSYKKWAESLSDKADPALLKEYNRLLKNPDKELEKIKKDKKKGGGYKSEMRKAHMGSSRRRSKCKRKYDPKTISRLIKQNPKEYPTNKEDNYWKQNQVWIRKNRKLVSDDKKQIKQCMKKRKEKHKESVRKVNKKFKAESKKAKAELKKDCCKCHYVKSKKGSLRKVRGPWTHCSYDMANCCKDKKTIVEEKGGGKKTFKKEQKKENKEYYQSVKKCRKMKKDKSGKQKKCYRKVNKVRTKTLNRFQKEYPEEWSKFMNKSSGMGGSHAKTRLEGSWM